MSAAPHSPGRRAIFVRWLPGCVVATLALVAVCLAIPLLASRYYTTDRNSKVRMDLVALHSGLEEYVHRYGSCPATLDGLLTSADPRGVLEVDALPRDPWGVAYRYAIPTDDADWPIVYTLGSDAAPGGEGDEADVYSLDYVRGRR